MYNPQVDSYIERSADFARPILESLRTSIHDACPLVEEKIKWSFPNFEYKGSILCSMASFKNHCTFGFWLGAKMDDPNSILNPVGETAMGQLGKLRSLNDLPSKEILLSYIHQAMLLIDQGVKLTKKEPVNNKTLKIPESLVQALGTNDKAKATFESFSPSNKKEYIDWITDAKTDATKTKRLETTIEWLSEGKVKNWKYVKK